MTLRLHANKRNKALATIYFELHSVLAHKRTTILANFNFYVARRGVGKKGIRKIGRVTKPAKRSQNSSRHKALIPTSGMHLRVARAVNQCKRDCVITRASDACHPQMPDPARQNHRLSQKQHTLVISLYRPTKNCMSVPDRSLAEAASSSSSLQKALILSVNKQAYVGTMVCVSDVEATSRGRSAAMFSSIRTQASWTLRSYQVITQRPTSKYF